MTAATDLRARSAGRALALLALCTPAAAQTWEDSDPLFTHAGENPGDGFGWIGVLVGDADADGTNDYLLTTPSFGGGLGRAYVYSGATGAVLHVTTGATPSGLGYMADGVGDLDADGHDDFVLGAPDLSNVTAGSATVHSGATGAVLHSFSGELPGDQFGKAVSWVGDVDADGTPDVLIAAPRNDEGGNLSGKVYVYSGVDGALLYSWTGSAALDFLGSGVAGIGDRDGDGHADILIGAIGAGPQSRGEAYVRSGADGALQCTLSGDATSGSYGLYWLGRAGDIDADGVGDFFVTDYTNAALGPSTGRAYVYSGADCSPIYTLTGLAPGDGFGIGRGWLGDVNADGHDDLVLAHWVNDQGAQNAGRLSVISGATGEVLFRFTGDAAGGQLGFDVAGLGDLDGDGWPEILGTSPPAAGGAGEAYVFSTNPTPPTVLCDASANSVGAGALLDYQRHTSISANDLKLVVSGAPPAQSAQVIYAPLVNAHPFGDGTLCVGGGIVRLGSPSTVGAGGMVFANLNFNQAPLGMGPGAVAAGDTRHFQCWYRDPSGPGGTGVNLSSALTITFRP